MAAFTVVGLMKVAKDSCIIRMERRLLSMRNPNTQTRVCMIIRPEIQRDRVQAQGAEGEFKTLTFALTGSEVITFETSPWRLNVGSIVCLSTIMKSVLNGSVDWIKEGKLQRDGGSSDPSLRKHLWFPRS